MVFSGVSKSVCGMEWLLEYLKRLTSDEKLNVKHELDNIDCWHQRSARVLFWNNFKPHFIPIGL